MKADNRAVILTGPRSKQVLCPSHCHQNPLSSILQALVCVAAIVRGVDQERSFQSSLQTKVERIDLGAVHEAEQGDAQHARDSGTLKPTPEHLKTRLMLHNRKGTIVLDKPSWHVQVTCN